jgi:hypothetical protein
MYVSAAIFAFIVPQFIYKMSMKWALFLSTICYFPVLLMVLCSTYKYKYPKSNLFLLNYTFIYTLTIISNVIGGSCYSIVLIGMCEYIT